MKPSRDTLASSARATSTTVSPSSSSTSRTSLILSVSILTTATPSALMSMSFSSLSDGPRQAATIEANTSFGALYGLESFSQLIKDFTFDHSNYEVEDFPVYKHRGIMIDTGRRFFPVSTVCLSSLDSCPLGQNDLGINALQQVECPSLPLV